MELILATVFKAVEWLHLFKRFCEQLSFILRDGFRAFQDLRINDYKDWRYATILAMKVKASLEKESPRYDYKCRTVSTFSVFCNGGSTRSDQKAWNHARWMAI